MIAVAFALTVSGLVFAWRHHEFMQPPLKVVPVARIARFNGPIATIRGGSRQSGLPNAA